VIRLRKVTKLYPLTQSICWDKVSVWGSTDYSVERFFTDTNYIRSCFTPPHHKVGLSLLSPDLESCHPRNTPKMPTGVFMLQTVNHELIYSVLWVPITICSYKLDKAPPHETPYLDRSSRNTPKMPTGVFMLQTANEVLLSFFQAITTRLFEETIREPSVSS